jgi:hypothetical protein
MAGIEHDKVEDGKGMEVFKISGKTLANSDVKMLRPVDFLNWKIPE